MLYPLGYAIWLSLFNYDLGAQQRTRLHRPRQLPALLRRAVLGLAGPHDPDRAGGGRAGILRRPAVAYGLYQLTFGVRTLNLLLFLPNIVTPVVAALFLRWIFVGRWGLLTAR